VKRTKSEKAQSRESKTKEVEEGIEDTGEVQRTDILQQPIHFQLQLPRNLWSVPIYPFPIFRSPLVHVPLPLGQLDVILGFLDRMKFQPSRCVKLSTRIKFERVANLRFVGRVEIHCELIPSEIIVFSLVSKLSRRVELERKREREKERLTQLSYKLWRVHHLDPTLQSSSRRLTNK